MFPHSTTHPTIELGHFVWQARHYDLEPNNPDGCAPCNCDPGASTSLECPADTGMCTCMENIGGRDCRTPTSGNYVPKLDVMTYDAEFAFNATVSDFQSKSEIFSIGGFRGREIPSISCSFWEILAKSYLRGLGSLSGSVCS